MGKKILIAVDGSVHSSNIIHYLGRLFGRLEDTHYHLLYVVPCSVPQSGREWMDELALLSALSPQARGNMVRGQKYMTSAIIRLGEHGVKPEQISTETMIMREGIARDIIREAQRELYDALVIGRRGLSAMEEMIMGSVSQTILKKADIPVWLIDGQVDSCKFLVPVDGSLCVLRALDHLAFILGDNPCAEITLFHSEAFFSRSRKLTKEECQIYMDSEWCEAHRDCQECLFHAPERLLTEQGIPKELIRQVKTDKGLHPSRQIVRQALVGDFGTIVMGRSRDAGKGFLARISDRVVAMVENTAIWLI